MLAFSSNEPMLRCGLHVLETPISTLNTELTGQSDFTARRKGEGADSPPAVTARQRCVTEASASGHTAGRSALEGFFPI